MGKTPKDVPSGGEDEKHPHMHGEDQRIEMVDINEAKHPHMHGEDQPNQL